MSSIRMRATSEGNIVTVECLIHHPMESGFNKDPSGALIPPHYIKTIIATSNGRAVFTAFWGPAVSKDPFLSFSYSGGRKGDPLTIAWTDNRGQADSTTASVL